MSGPGEKALIADDDEFFRMALATLLKHKLGFKEVVETGSLDEAIERLSDTPDVSLALFDLDMPGVQSPASLRAVREVFPALRVAVVSSSDDREDVLQALRAGVHGYVSKVVGVAEVPRALQAIVAGSIYVPASVAILPSAEDDLAATPPAARPPAPLEELLTPRQRQCLELVIQGKSNKEIARELNLSDATVKVHMAALLRSMGVNSRTAAAVAGAKLLSASQSASTR